MPLVEVDFGTDSSIQAMSHTPTVNHPFLLDRGRLPLDRSLRLDNPIRRLLCVYRGETDLARLVFERLDPRGHVRATVPWLVPDAELLAGHHRPYLHPQFLTGVRLCSEPLMLDERRSV